jgi:hypothetical protein
MSNATISQAPSVSQDDKFMLDVLRLIVLLNFLGGVGIGIYVLASIGWTPDPKYPTIKQVNPFGIFLALACFIEAITVSALLYAARVITESVIAIRRKAER